MKPITDDLLMALNIKAESQTTKYIYQIEYTFNTIRKNIYPKRKVIKYVNCKLVNKVTIYNQEELIKYLNSELLLYN